MIAVVGALGAALTVIAVVQKEALRFCRQEYKAVGPWPKLCVLLILFSVADIGLRAC